MRIVFFNHLHNGDLHVSREIIHKIIDKVYSINPNTTFVYTHYNDPCLLSDIPNLGFDPNLIKNISARDNLKTLGNDIYINTWYAQQDGKYILQYGDTIDTLYTALDDTCKQLWKFSLTDISTDISDFFPTIDYSKFEIESTKEWLIQHQEKKIFVANGHAKSGQADNFNMTEIIIKLAEKNIDKTFILSNKECDQELPNNVVYSSDIIKKQNGSDLNENSFISSHCDVIIGRASGPSTFAITQEVLFKKQTKIINFSKMWLPPNKFWVGPLFKDKINYTANIICTEETNIEAVSNIIESNII